MTGHKDKGTGERGDKKSEVKTELRTGGQEKSYQQTGTALHMLGGPKGP